MLNAKCLYFNVFVAWVVFDLLIGDKGQKVAFKQVELTDAIS